MDLNYICTNMSNLCGMPIRLYHNNHLVFYHSPVYLPKDPMLAYQQPIWKVSAHVGYYVTPAFDYYGIVNSAQYKIILGPTRQTANSHQELRELAFLADVPSEDVDSFIIGMKSIARMPIESIMQTLCILNYLLNDEKLALEDIAIYDEQQQSLTETMERQRAEQLFTQEEPEIQHNTFSLEETIMNIIQKGDSAALQEWISTAPAVRPGILASEQLRQLKNTFIVTTTLASRAAIRGGMDAEDALSLSDLFIQKCEILGTPDRLLNLQYHMIQDFTQRVERIRLGRRPTQLIIDISNYMHHHLSEPITTQEIANHLYISRPYLSQKFKKETGQTLTDFILKEKCEEAKRLLRYTSKSLTAIALYLGFSSQSHFSRVYKNYTGLSPGEYRNRLDKSPSF